MGDAETMASMTEERVLEMCAPTFDEADLAGWSEKDVDAEKRRLIRAIRHISEEATAMSGHHLIAVDELASWQEKGSPPSPRRMVECYKNRGTVRRFPIMRSLRLEQMLVGAISSLH